MKSFFTYWRHSRGVQVIVLLLLGVVLVLVVSIRSRPYSQFILKGEPARNYSLLVDDERFPISVDEGQSLKIEVLGNPANARSLPTHRIQMTFSAVHEPLARVRESRFRFYFDAPSSLRVLRSRENLDRLKKPTDWETVRSVLLWTQRQFPAGQPRSMATTRAMDFLPALRNNKEKGFCSHYCYVLVQSLQALGIPSRYVTIQGHEVAEAWIPAWKKWVALDPMNAAYFEDKRGRKQSAWEIRLDPDGTRAVSPLAIDSKALVKGYSLLAYWLRNDLGSRDVHAYDLNRWRVRLVQTTEEALTVDIDDLLTFFPEDVYFSPES